MSSTVRRVQRFLSLNPDGVYGSNTKEAVIKFQREMGLSPDGVIGPLTLSYMFPFPDDDTKNSIILTMKNHDILTVKDKSNFLAQTAHESGNFKRFEENLNYSARGLMTVWPSRFKNIEMAEIYARQPQKIANKVYANRMGNGDELSGDGWRYRGRGAIQLTGKDNYRRFCYLDDPDSLCRLPECFRSAALFWEANRLNGKSVDNATRIINGGYKGLEDRRQKYSMFMKLLNTGYL